MLTRIPTIAKCPSSCPKDPLSSLFCNIQVIHGGATPGISAGVGRENGLTSRPPGNATRESVIAAVIEIHFPGAWKNTSAYEAMLADIEF